MDPTATRSQDGQAIGELATVAHSIRDYLQRILGCAEVLLEERELGEPFSDVDLLRQIRRNVFGAHLLMTNYLEVKRIEAGLLSVLRQPVQLADLLHRVGSQYRTEAQRRQMALEVHLPLHLP